jgi:hypothetical protein
MADTLTNEQFEAKIALARSGDVGQAASLLRWMARILEQDLPLPEPLRAYLIEAFRCITKDDTPDSGMPPHPVIKTMEGLRESMRYLEETRDANVALNLTRPRGRKRTITRTLIEAGILTMMVDHARETGQSLEQAIGTVADRMEVSDKTVSRALHLMKHVPPRDSK